MPKVLVGTTMSLDGFIEDRNGSVSRLYPDLAELRKTEMLKESMKMTGAALMGRKAFDMAQGDLTGYEYQTPIFVLTHHVPETPIKGQNDKLKVHFITDGVESAIEKAKAAAGADKVVTVVGGASTAQQIIQKGLADELEIGIVPVLLGDGLRFFGTDPLELELIRVYQSPGRTDLRYRVVKGK